MNNYLDQNIVQALLPELIVLLSATLVYVLGAFGEARRIFQLGSVVGWLIAGYALYLGGPEGSLNSPLLFTDALATQGRWLVWWVGLVVLLACGRATVDRLAPEFLGSVMLLFLGLMLTCQARDLILLFLGFELVSIPTYILLYLGRNDARIQEATLKYFLLSLFSSGLMLFGFALLYGIAGTTDVQQLTALVSTTGGRPLVGLLPLALVLVLGGLAFKLAAVPFHFYAPDVYQGTTPAGAMLLSIAPKAAGLVAMGRLLILAMAGGEFASIAWKLMAVLAVVTMTLGNVLALRQKSVRRIMAYSSVAHAGYMLVGLAIALAGELSAGLMATLAYFALYALGTLCFFAGLICVMPVTGDRDRTQEFSGLARQHYLPAVAMAVGLFSLLGIPPLPGFFGKLWLVQYALRMDGTSTLQVWFLSLAIATVVNAAISAGYYLPLVARFFFDEAEAPTVRSQIASSTSATLAASLAILLSVVAIPSVDRLILSPARQAADELAQPPVREASVEPASPALAQQAPPAPRRGS